MLNQFHFDAGLLELLGQHKADTAAADHRRCFNGVDMLKKLSCQAIQGRIPFP
jgi:hypothetical protein